MLDETAPKTCQAVWDVLPQEGMVFHAKYASNEIYALVSGFPADGPVVENRSVTPAAGDVCYFYFPAGFPIPEAAADQGLDGKPFVDLAVFYDRDNLLISPREGFTPANVFATIVRNLDQMKQAGNSIWREGAVDERLIYRRLEGDSLKEWGIDPG